MKIAFYSLTKAEMTPGGYYDGTYALTIRFYILQFCQIVIFSCF